MPTWRGIDFCLQAPADFSLVPTLLDQAQDSVSDAAIVPEQIVGAPAPQPARYGAW